MFSGKTEELIRRLRRARFAKQRVEIFKPAVDIRYSTSEVVSHDENALVSQAVSTAAQILLMAGDAQVIGIDEAQFFDSDLARVCKILAADGRRVIVAGLDQDFRGEPFEPVPQIMAIAEYVTKLHAICVICGSPANHSQRIVTSRDRVLVGATEAYEPRCRDCFDPGDESDAETSASTRAEMSRPADIIPQDSPDAGPGDAVEAGS
jgi:thymidine kinase